MAHCVGCKAGLSESCKHIASTIICIKCWARVNGKMACTQVKCSWLLPTYVKEVSYARIKDFTSAKKLKEILDSKIDSLDQNVATCHETGNEQITPAWLATTMEMENARLSPCEGQALTM